MVAMSQPENRAQNVKKSNDFSGSLITVLEPTGTASEAYRTLRTSLLYTLGDTSRLIVVTSSGLVAGKSTVCANLGVVLAQAGMSILIADCDLRVPTMHEMFGLDGSRGIVDALGQKQELEGLYHQPLPDLDLKVLTAGVRPTDPAELLSVPRISAFFAGVREEFDYVLVNAPPTGLISDPLILANQADGVLLTLDARKTSKHALQRSVHDLNAVGANLLGTIVDNAQASRNGYL